MSGASTGTATGAPDPPYVAVVFTSRRTVADDDGYARTAARMEALAAEQPGHLGVVSVRDPDGLGITVSYWTDEDAARAWQRHGEHLLAQRTGRDVWYDHYTVEVATVTRRSSYDARRPPTTEEPR